MIQIYSYILKVIVCSGTLFLYYFLFLRNRQFHQWNRFYLLFSFVLSLLIPFVHINIFSSQEAPDMNMIRLLKIIQAPNNIFENETVGQQKQVIVPWMVLGLYSLISMVLLTGFVRSVYKIYGIICSHKVQCVSGIKFVQTRVDGTPFSFLNFIFWNENIELHSETGRQIFEHELLHVQQKHSLDKIFVQLILICFWINPFFWLMRNELKMVHEFIADNKATKDKGAGAFAAMLIHSAYPIHYNSLTNPIFQTSIKRRLAMITKIHSSKLSHLSRILVLPFIALLAFAFTTRKVPSGQIHTDKKIIVVIDAGHGIENGKHSGARFAEFNEDDINLSIAKKVFSLNHDANIQVILTRSNDYIVPLKERVQLAANSHADAFISIHVNAEPNLSPSHSGMEVIITGKNPAQEFKSRLLGSAVQEELNAVYPTAPDLKQMDNGIFVVDHNICPAVLIECGYINNDKDRSFITNNKNQDKIAAGILNAIAKFSQQEGVNNGLSVNNVDTVPKSKIAIKNENKSQADIIADKPLYVVDGKVLGTDPESIKSINTNNIASINVLKGESALKEYGEKGKNGVVKITMKKGQKPESEKRKDLN